MVNNLSLPFTHLYILSPDTAPCVGKLAKHGVFSHVVSYPVVRHAQHYTHLRAPYAANASPRSQPRELGRLRSLDGTSLQ